MINTNEIIEEIYKKYKKTEKQKEITDELMKNIVKIEVKMRKKIILDILNIYAEYIKEELLIDNDDIFYKHINNWNYLINQSVINKKFENIDVIKDKIINDLKEMTKEEIEQLFNKIYNSYTNVVYGEIYSIRLLRNLIYEDGYYESIMKEGE